MSAFEIRTATQADAAAIGALHVASWRETYAGILPDATLAALSADARSAMWADVLGDPRTFGDAVVFVAVSRGEIAGFGTCARQRDDTLAAAGFDGEIGAVYVLRAHQHHGIGRALLATISTALTQQGYRGASLWVLRENAPARRFYEALHGEIVGEQAEEQPGATLVELAYGWRDLSLLAS